jgi:hypothetical protein
VSGSSCHNGWFSCCYDGVYGGHLSEGFELHILLISDERLLKARIYWRMYKHEHGSGGTHLSGG